MRAPIKRAQPRVARGTGRRGLAALLILALQHVHLQAQS
jgi:hypothetical protein